jgi:tetratricopeptide (TPR) repeat protein
MRRAVVALVCCTALVTAVARAEPSSDDHYEAGKRLFLARRYAEALEEFRRALAVAPRPEVLYSMAQAQRMLGDCPGAIETYRAFLAGQPGEPLAEYARANIERCEAMLHSPERSGPERGGPERGGPERGGPERGGPERGGPERGGPERGGPERGGSGRPWYRDGVGDMLVGGGVVAGGVGALIWWSGRSTASAVAGAPDYQTFLQRRSRAGSALAEQEIGIAAMIAGGAAVVAGVVHYVRDTGPARRELALGVAPTPGGAMLSGRGTF